MAAASLAPNGLVGVLNFAGGRGSDWPRSDKQCGREQLVAAFGAYGKTVRVPTQWIYAENDHFFPPPLARAMFESFVRSGGRGDLVIAPPYGSEGHYLVDAPAAWNGLVDAFLRRNALPTWLRPTARDMLPLSPPAGLTEKGTQGFREYLASENYEKAFVVGEGRSGWAAKRRTVEDAIAAAMKACVGNSGATCKPYAINDTLATSAAR